MRDFVIEQAHVAGASSLQARCYADSADALSVLSARGFRETMRITGLALDNLQAVSVDPFASLGPALESRGIRFTTLEDELRTDPRSWEKLPRRESGGVVRVARARSTSGRQSTPAGDGTGVHGSSARIRHDSRGVLIAAVDDQYVGYSALAVSDEARTRANSGGTAVRPEYRGLGLATALKGRCIRWARENGVRSLVTGSGNPAMSM